jgi:hypothetical protein
MKLAISPSTLVWDANNTATAPDQYRFLASSVVSLFQLIEENDLKIVANPNLLNGILTSFPYSKLTEDWHHFGDFILATTNFISRNDPCSGRFLTYPSGEFPHTSTPILSKEHFNEDLKSAIPSLLAAIWSCYRDSILIDAENAQDHWVIKNGVAEAQFELVAPSDYEEYFDNIFGRIYEPHKKHHPTYGWGTKLPNQLSNDDLQKLLDNAVSVRGLSKSYLVFSNKCSIYIRFRRHHANKFHAYPITEDEISKIRGVTLGAIPAYE